MTESAQERMDRSAAAANEWSAKNIADGGVCDFCCAELAGKPVVTYTTAAPISELIVGVAADGVGTVEHVADEYWAACANCDPVVQQGDPVKLAEHVADNANYERIGSDRDTYEVARLASLYRQFFARAPQRSEGIPAALAAEKLRQIIAEYVANTEIYGFEYPDYATAKAVYDRNKPLVGRLMEDREDCGASVWTTADPETESRFFVVVADTRLGLREAADWGDGVPYEMGDRASASLMERHVGLLLEQLAEGKVRSKVDRHYGLGAEVRPGNDVRIRAGGDQ